MEVLTSSNNWEKIKQEEEAKFGWI